MKYEKKYGKKSNIGRALTGCKSRPPRTERALAAAERTSASPLPREMSAKILGNPKNKLTAKARRRVMRSRDLVVTPDVKLVSKPMADRIAANVAQLIMSQLVRQVTQCSHQIRRAKSILEDLSPDSSFAPELRRNIAVNVLVLRTVEAEIIKRTKSPAVRDTRTPRVRKWDALKAAIAAKSSTN